MQVHNPRIWPLCHLVLAALVLLLAACGASEEPTPQATASLPTSLPPTATPTNTSTPVSTATASPLPPITSLLSKTVPSSRSAESAAPLSQTIALLPTATPSPTPLPSGVVNADLVNLRSESNLNGELVGVANEGDAIEVVEISDDGQWLRVCCPGDEAEPAWISREFAEVEGIAPETIADAEAVAEQPDTVVATTAERDVSEPTGIVNADLINVRGGPGTNYAVVGQVRAGQEVAITGRDARGDWWEICCPAGQDTTSWLIGEYLDVLLPTGLTAESIALAQIPPTPEPPPVVQVAASGVGGVNPAVLAAAPAPGIPGAGGFGAAGGANPLTGLPLPAERSGQRPVIVCVNNDYAARPQFGLSGADVMYEYLMEGYGITRFSAVFYGDTVGQIGPVRSARLINYYMGALYDAGLACSGASDAVRYTLKHESPFPYMDIDLDDPSNTRYSVSVGSDYRTRLRTATDKLRRWLAEWGVEKPGSLRGFTFGSTPSGGVPATSITIPYPAGTGTQVGYRYDGSGRYLRSMGGGAHVDGNSGAQLALDNVVVQYVPHEATDIVEDSLGSTSIRLNLFGSGRALVFRDGQAFDGTWRSESRGDMPRFFGENGEEIPLKPGRTWISVVPFRYTISYQ